MPREIKFRVWDSISKKMHPWYKINTIPLHDFFKEHYTLQQYIGLRDKNGTYIYEGDIIQVYEYYTDPKDLEEDEENQFTSHLVKYFGEDDYPAFDVWPSLDSDANGISSLIAQTWDGPEHFEVVGNIYENPELQPF